MKYFPGAGLHKIEVGVQEDTFQTQKTLIRYFRKREERSFLVRDRCECVSDKKCIQKRLKFTS